MCLKIDYFFGHCPRGLKNVLVALNVYRERAHARHVRHRWVRREQKFQNRMRIMDAALDLAAVEDTEDYFFYGSSNEVRKC
jgi:hypothetical protein